MSSLDVGNRILELPNLGKLALRQPARASQLLKAGDVNLRETARDRRAEIRDTDQAVLRCNVVAQSVRLRVGGRAIKGKLCVFEQPYPKCMSPSQNTAHPTTQVYSFP